MALPRVGRRHGPRSTDAPNEADIDAVYDVFVPKNIRVAASYSQVIPGVSDVVSALRADDIRIGTTTGYTREIIDEIVPGAARRGVRAGQHRLHGRHARGTAVAVHDLPEPAATGRVAREGRDQGGRYRGRHRGRH